METFEMKRAAEINPCREFFLRGAAAPTEVAAPVEVSPVVSERPVLLLLAGAFSGSSASAVPTLVGIH